MTLPPLCSVRPARNSLDGDPTPRAAGFTAHFRRGEPAAVGDGPGSVPNAAAAGTTAAPLPPLEAASAASPAKAAVGGTSSASGSRTLPPCASTSLSCSDQDLSRPCWTTVNLTRGLFDA